MNKAPTIERRYVPQAGACMAALKALLQKNAAGVDSTNGDDAMKGSENDRATKIIPRPS